MSVKNILPRDQAQWRERRLLDSTPVQPFVRMAHIRTLDSQAEGIETAAVAVAAEDVAVVGIGAAADTEAAVDTPPTYRYDSVAAVEAIHLEPEPVHPALAPFPAAVQEAAKAAQLDP